MNETKSLIKQTLIYGLATVLPRMFSFFLVPLYTSPGVLNNKEYGIVTIVFSYIIFVNVLLSYGMETTFFRFFHKSEKPNNVQFTAQISIVFTSFTFLIFGLLFQKTIASFVDISSEVVQYAVWILFFDAMVVIPFALLRAQKKAMTYAVIKIANVSIMLFLNVFFLMIVPKLSFEKYPLLEFIKVEENKIVYIFISNLIASGLTLLVFLPHYFKKQGVFEWQLWKQMMTYGIPILFAGIAFAINEHLDKILLEWLNVPLEQIGSYSACYKIGVFMVLFRTAFTLGIEPFFFSKAQDKDAPKTYATITKYFVVIGSLAMFFVVLIADLIKPFLIRNESFWDAMSIVPIIILANFMLGIYTNLSVWYKVIDKTWIGALISVLGAVVTIVVNIVTIPKIGYIGSAIATLLCYGLMSSISFYFGQKKYPIPYPKKEIFGYLFISTLFSLVYFYYFRENYLVGILFLIILITFTYIKEKNNLAKILWNKTV